MNEVRNPIPNILSNPRAPISRIIITAAGKQGNDRLIIAIAIVASRGVRVICSKISGAR